jgi:hypothetical protein
VQNANCKLQNDETGVVESRRQYRDGSSNCTLYFAICNFHCL